ncbi:uncharacterized protein TNCV_2676771 [Trichonephila clavipes]|nr:uncharacterized protein TNCV_2676771 [Trichonephila clavipes]
MSSMLNSFYPGTADESISAKETSSTRESNKEGTTRGLLATDHVILNHGQVTWTTPELAPPILTTTPHQREDVLALDRFNVHRCPTRRVFSGTGLELVTRQATVQYLYHSATAATVNHRKDAAYYVLCTLSEIFPCSSMSKCNNKVETGNNYTDILVRKVNQLRLRSEP